MNAIIEMILENRKGMYVHALEVVNLYDLQSCIESLYAELVEDFDVDTFIDFITSMEIYCTEEENEDEVYDFNIEEFIKKI